VWRGSGRPRKVTLLVETGLIEKMQKIPKMRFGGTKVAKKKVVTGQYSTVRLRPQKIWRSTIASIINKYILNNTV